MKQEDILVMLSAGNMEFVTLSQVIPCSVVADKNNVTLIRVWIRKEEDKKRR